MTDTGITSQELRQLDAWWRAANYLSVGQIYLYANPLLTEPLTIEHIKPRLLGHWGTTPGLNFIYAHANRIIKKYDLNMIYICGPGHGGPGMVANTWLEGTYTEFFPNITRDAEGIQRLFTQFSFPGGIPSHAAPETPGSIHEGGELGYSLLHAYGAVFDNPDLLACCVIGDGEAETGALAASWHSNKFLNPARDGAVIPILHLNGYKIAGPSFLARIPQEQLAELLSGYGYHPYFVEGHDPELMHHAMGSTLETVLLEIQKIQKNARERGVTDRPQWPMIVLVSPKGWTGPKEVDGKQIEGTSRAHQVPLDQFATKPDHIRLLENWMKSYRPDELFDDEGRPVAEVTALAPHGQRRMSANPHANGGLLLKDLSIPDFRGYAVEVAKPGATSAEATRVLGELLRDVMRDNLQPGNFRVFGPDETASNRLNAVFEVTDRELEGVILPHDDHIARNGRVMEVLSEHLCQGWLEGYLLTGRHGFFSCYEAFIHIVDSMFNQHAKWLKASLEIPWRKPIASLNYLLTSHVWRQDHNGFSHQDPGFIDHVINKKADVVRVYLPPDANCLLSVADHCLRSRNYVNVIVAGKQPSPQWLDMDAAIQHCTAGLGIWEWASNDGGEPDVVLACCGDVPTLETLAAVDLLRTHLPHLKIRVVNVVDLMALQPSSEHPHGMPDDPFDAVFTKDKPIVFAFHGYPWLIHRLMYRRTNHDNLHVRGYKEEGTTTTPFDMTVMNDMDRFHLAGDVVARVPGLDATAVEFKQMLRKRLIDHKLYIARHGDDMPEIPRLEVARGVKILVLNAGSSSLKCWYHDIGSETAGEEPPAEPLWKITLESPAAEQIDEVLRSIPGSVDVVGHRIVHGGSFHQSALLTPEVRAAIAQNAPMAPEHNRRELLQVTAVDRVFGSGIPQVAVFDTAFHATLEPHAYVYPGPYSWLGEGIRRYGFHGISYQYAARRAAQLLGKDPSALRLIACHLGNGASLAAIRGGRSIDTTMGFTPLEGLMMGSRGGSVDPGILLYLLRRGHTADQLDDLLNRQSGLLGVSGISSDMREILALRERGEQRAQLAFDIYTHRLVREIGGMLAVLGGLDALVFTGGVGENCAPLREAAVAQLGFLPDLRVLVIHAEEEWEIARECRAVISGR